MSYLKYLQLTMGNKLSSIKEILGEENYEIFSKRLSVSDNMEKIMEFAFDLDLFLYAPNRFGRDLTSEDTEKLSEEEITVLFGEIPKTLQKDN